MSSAFLQGGGEGLKESVVIEVASDLFWWGEKNWGVKDNITICGRVLSCMAHLFTSSCGSPALSLCGTDIKNK